MTIELLSIGHRFLLRLRVSHVGYLPLVFHSSSTRYFFDVFVLGWAIERLGLLSYIFLYLYTAHTIIYPSSSISRLGCFGNDNIKIYYS